jgi:hypothetical protein
VVERQAGEGDLAADARELQDAAAALCAKVRHDGTGDLDRAREVRAELTLDLLVAHLLRRPEQAVPGVRDDDVDAPELGEGRVHDVADQGGVGDVEGTDPEPVGVRRGELAEPLGPAQGRSDAVAAREQLPGQLAAEAARGAGDEPRGSHGVSFLVSAPTRRVRRRPPSLHPGSWGPARASRHRAGRLFV